MKKIIFSSLIASQSFAASFVIPAGVTQNTQEVLTNPNDTGLIEQGGTLSTAGTAVRMLNSDQSLLNNGNIQASGASGFGVELNTAPSGRVENNGNLVTTGSNGRGVYSIDSPNSTIINNGLIDTTGTGAYGVYNTNSAGNHIENNDTLITRGSSAHGIYNFISDGISVENKGTISILNSSARGIYNSSSVDVNLINRGSIEMLGGGSGYGISNLAGDRAHIENSGSIATYGIGSLGIHNSSSPDVVIDNSGSIVTHRLDSDAIFNTFSNNTTVNNTGTIETLDKIATGVYSTDSSQVKVFNEGTITTRGETSDGVEFDNTTDSLVKNCGTIQALGLNSNGVNLNGSSITFTNCGSLISDQGYALRLNGAGHLVNLEVGSNIQGKVTSLTNTFDIGVEKGLNLALTLDEGSFGFGQIITPNPYVVIDNTLVVVDRTGFALQSDVLADLSDTVLGGVYRHRFGFGSECSDCSEASCDLTGWVEGLGSYRDRSSSSRLMSYHNNQGGFLVGLDKGSCGNYFGAFGGVLFGEARISKNPSKANTTSYIAGLTYERVGADTFWGAALSLGYVEWKNRRTLMNNLAANGIEMAHADSDALLLMPDVTYTHNFACLPFRPNLTIQGRYAGLFFGDSREKGSSYNLKTSSRNVQLLTGRIELGLPLSVECGASCLALEPYIGGLIRYQPGDQCVKGEILDHKFHFNQGAQDSLGLFVYGLRTSHNLGACSLYLNIEGSADTKSSRRVLGELGIAWSF